MELKLLSVFIGATGSNEKGMEAEAAVACGCLLHII
jgi:hypothetical protein